MKQLLSLILALLSLSAFATTKECDHALVDLSDYSEYIGQNKAHLMRNQVEINLYQSVIQAAKQTEKPDLAGSATAELEATVESLTKANSRLQKSIEDSSGTLTNLKNLVKESCR